MLGSNNFSKKNNNGPRIISKDKVILGGKEYSRKAVKAFLITFIVMTIFSLLIGLPLFTMVLVRVNRFAVLLHWWM